MEYISIGHGIARIDMDVEDLQKLALICQSVSPSSLPSFTGVLTYGAAFEAAALACWMDANIKPHGTNYPHDKLTLKRMWKSVRRDAKKDLRE